MPLCFSSGAFKHFVLCAAFLLSLEAASSELNFVLPESQSAHFCQLLVSSNEGLLPLSAYAPPSAPEGTEREDSGASKQILVDYLLHDRNWQLLRIFPHRQADGSVVWYAPADELPPQMDAEHQKYIRQVLPRLIAEAEAGHWQTVDAYIDRMIRYQCQFGGSKQPAPPSPTAVAAPIIAIAALMALCIFPRCLVKLG